MKTLMIMAVITVTLLLSTFTHASSVETYTFTKPEYELRFHKLKKILRCQKCKNKNVAD
jgi:cytochrome c-type biogenesis protein CcmH/NrfF